MYEDLKAKYDESVRDGQEKDKTISFQKAKIAALQSELEEALKNLAESETKLDLADKESGKNAEVDKKVQDKMNALNLQVSKLKS